MSRRTDPRHPAPRFPAAVLTTAWQSASLLLGYPDERLPEVLAPVRAALPGLPPQLRDPLAEVVGHL